VNAHALFMAFVELGRALACVAAMVWWARHGRTSPTHWGISIVMLLAILGNGVPQS
jgi:hypothetical protein